MSASKRESWGSLRKLPSGRWQARYPGPDGGTYTARTEGDKAPTFLTKTDARTWLAAVHTKKTFTASSATSYRACGHCGRFSIS
jgi:hypothetical protein